MADPRKYITAGSNNQVIKAPSPAISSNPISTAPTNTGYVNKITTPAVTNPFNDKPLTEVSQGNSEVQNNIPVISTSKPTTSPQIGAGSIQPLTKQAITPSPSTVTPVVASPVKPTTTPIGKQTLTEQAFNDAYTKGNAAQKATLDEQKRLGLISVTPSSTTPPLATAPTASPAWQTTLDKTAQALGLKDYNEFKTKYGDIIDPTLGKIFDATDPNQAAALQGQLQSIMGAKVGTVSDLGMIGGQRDSILSNFTNGQEVLDTYQSITNELKKGNSIEQVAKTLGLPLNKVTDFIQGKFEKYGTLTEAAQKKASESTKMEIDNLNKEDMLAKERTDSDYQRLRQQYDTQYQRTTKQNEINESNANILARMTGVGFSTKGIQGLQTIQTQAKQLLDDLTSNYDHAAGQINDIKKQLAQAYIYNNEKLQKSLNDALTNAKNTYMSNVIGLQEKYGTTGLEGQKAIAEATNGFIKTAQDLYNKNFDNQMQLYGELRNQSTTIRQNEIQDQTIRKNNFEQFKEVSNTMNTSQVIDYAKRNNLTSLLPDLLAQRASSAVNSLNNLKGFEAAQLGTRFAAQIQKGLDANIAPDAIVGQIMKSPEFQKALDETPMSAEQRVALQANILDLKTKQADYNQNYGDNTQSNYTPVSYTPAPVEEVQKDVVSFSNANPDKSVGGECGAFVNKYLSTLGLKNSENIFVDPIQAKKSNVNSYTPTVGSIAVFDYTNNPNATLAQQQYGHVAIITKVNTDANGNVVSFDTKESNSSAGDNKVFSRKNIPVSNAYGFFDPTKAPAQPVAKDIDTLIKTNKNYQLANNILNGIGSLPSKNDKNYTKVLNAMGEISDQKASQTDDPNLKKIYESAKYDKEIDTAIVTKLTDAFTVLSGVADLTSQLENKKDDVGPIEGFLRNKNPYDVDAQGIAAQLNALVPKVARGVFGEVGVLTDQDIERYMKTLPNAKMTKNVAQVVGDLLKISVTKSIINTLATNAKANRNTVNFVGDYQMAADYLATKGISPNPFAKYEDQPEDKAGTDTTNIDISKINNLEDLYNTFNP